MTENDKPHGHNKVDGQVPAECAAVMVYTTFPSLSAAETMGVALVEGHLAGCVNILPGMVSIYLWEGARERSEEVVLIAKTTRQRAGDCMRAIIASHPYDNPAVLCLPVPAGARDYLAWIAAGTKLDAGR